MEGRWNVRALAALLREKHTTKPLNSSLREHQCNSYMKAYTI
jgi:hypothetical protein